MTSYNRNTIYAEASIVGLSRALLGLPLEHPLDSIKSRMQAEVSRKVSFYEMGKEIYRNQGIKNGLYAGLIPTASRNVIKQVYRWPLMLMLPQFYEKIIPTTLQQRYSSINKISTGLSMALIDTFLICPFERLKVLLQTKKEEVTLRSFFKENKSNLNGELFRGLTPFLGRQMVSWVSFLYLQHSFTQGAKQMKGLSPKDQLDDATLVFVSSLVGVANVMVVMPFDITKTLKQQHSTEFASLSLKDTIRRIKDNGGFSSFYKGWQPRMIQYVISSMMTVTAIEKLEHKIKSY